DDILGPIPKQEELMSEIKSIEDEIKAESEESTAMAGRGSSSRTLGGAGGVIPDPDAPTRPVGARSTTAPPPPSPAFGWGPPASASPETGPSPQSGSSPTTQDPKRKPPPTTP
ncbi:MAG: hypothetical protein L3J93_05990, partial [Thermoplasmata archaeon]|nr:hypothetical protein [Thermoplasmata archaeon]